jgi:hypothetical protein
MENRIEYIVNTINRRRRLLNSLNVKSGLLYALYLQELHGRGIYTEELLELHYLEVEVENKQNEVTCKCGITYNRSDKYNHMISDDHKSSSH